MKPLFSGNWTRARLGAPSCSKQPISKMPKGCILIAASFGNFSEIKIHEFKTSPLFSKFSTWHSILLSFWNWQLLPIAALDMCTVKNISCFSRQISNIRNCGCQYVYCWLVVWNMNFIFHRLGISSSQLANSIIFQRGRWLNHQADCQKSSNWRQFGSFR